MDLLGDLLFTMPLMAGLRDAYPSARITLVTLPYTAPIARLYPFVDEVVEVDTNRVRTLSGLLSPRTWAAYAGAWQKVRTERVDLCVSAYGRTGSLLAFLSGARRTVGYRREAYPFLLSDPVPGGRHQERIHEVEYVRRLARHLGVPAPETIPAPEIPACARRRVDELLAQQGVGPADPVALVHAGSVNGTAKRWPATHWARFVDDLRARTGATVVLTGAASDAPAAAQVLGRVRERVVSLVGQTDMVELAALVARASVVVSGDSGPLHLAVTLRRPLVAIYGPTDPAIYGPYRPAAAVRLHRTDLPCSPCYTLAAVAECPLGDPICMRLVSVDSVVDSAVALLTSPRGPAQGSTL